MNRALLPLLMVGLSASGLALVTRRQELSSSQRVVFMKRKLDLSKNVLEGLVKEDYNRVAENARGLKRLSQSAEWQDPTIPNVEQYLAYTKEFQKLADDLGAKAREKNL